MLLVDSSDSGMSDTITLHRAFVKAARWQIVVTLLFAAVAFVLANVHVALSILGGGLAVVLGGFAGMALARKQPATAGSALFLLLKAEAVKIVVIALVLLAVFKFYEQLVPLALIGGLACAALISGAALRTLDQE